MKPSQQLQIDELSKCCMTRRECQKFEYVQRTIFWRGADKPLDGHDSYWVRRLYNLYRMQILHNRKMVKHG